MVWKLTQQSYRHQDPRNPHYCFFYLIILYIGYYASKKESGDQTSQGLLLAGRRMPAWIGIFTMTATWVGGGYIIGTSEAVYDSARGLVWAQAPWGYALSLILGGLFLLKKSEVLVIPHLLMFLNISMAKKLQLYSLFLP